MTVRRLLLGTGIVGGMLMLVLMCAAGTAMADNARFYGDYSGSTSAPCKDTFTVRIGGDENMQCLPDYLYVPRNQNATTCAGVDQDGDVITQTVTVSDNTIHVVEVGESAVIPGQGWTEDITLTFSDDYFSFSMSGTSSSDDPEEECVGTVTGSGKKDEEQENSRFYGAFDYSMVGTLPLGCELSGKATFGNDYSKVCGDDYVYIPALGNRTRNSCSEADDTWTRTASVSGRRIILMETGECLGVPSPCWTEDIQFDFSNDYNSALAVGATFYADPNQCQGGMAGDLTRRTHDGGGGGCFIRTAASR